jgi:hypothetical protein
VHRTKYYLCIGHIAHLSPNGPYLKVFLNTSAFDHVMWPHPNLRDHDFNILGLHYIGKLQCKFDFFFFCLSLEQKVVFLLKHMEKYFPYCCPTLPMGTVFLIKLIRHYVRKFHCKLTFVVLKNSDFKDFYCINICKNNSSIVVPLDPQGPWFLTNLNLHYVREPSCKKE